MSVSVRLTETEKREIIESVLNAGKTAVRAVHMAKHSLTLCADLYAASVVAVVDQLCRAVPQLVSDMQDYQPPPYQALLLQVPTGLHTAMADATKGMKGGDDLVSQSEGSVLRFRNRYGHINVRAPVWTTMHLVPVGPETPDEAHLARYAELIKHVVSACAAQAEHNKTRELVNQLVLPCDTVKQITDAIPGVDKYFPGSVDNKVTAYAERLEERRRVRAEERAEQRGEPLPGGGDSPLAELKALQEKTAAEMAMMGLDT